MINRQNQRSSSNNSVSGVPRRTNFMNQPHMLAYINPEEERLLRGLGGTGQPGPGGIPAYPPSTQSGPGANVGPSNSGNSNRGEDRREREQQAARLANLQAQAAAAEQMMADQAAQQAAARQAALDAAFDDYTPTAAELNAQLGAAGQTNLTDVQYAQPVDYSVTGSGQDYTTAAQADTDVSGFEYGYDSDSGTLGSNQIAQPFQTGPAPRVDEYGGTSVGGDMFKDYRGFGGDNFTGYDLTGGGNTVGYSLGQNGVGGGTVTISPDGSFNVVSLDNSTTTPYGTLDEAMAAIQGNPVSQGVDYSTAGSFNTDSAETSALLSELGYGSDGSGLGSGATPQAITDLALGNGVPTDEEINTFRGAEAAYGSGQPVIDGGVDADALKANLRAKMLSDINARKREVEGTDDDGGFDRILGGQEDNFGVKPTEMTVQEVLDFQNQRGEGSYAAYSQDVNAKRGFFRDDGSPRISTPVGVNQVVGLNLQQMVDDGIIDPNDLYNEDTQNTISEYLIADKRGLDDYLDGNITLAQLEKNLGNEFEGIAIEGLYGDDQPTTAVASLAPDISLRPVPRQLASAETTGETSGEILARLAAQRESNRDTSGDVQVAAMDSRGPLSDTITSNLNLDEIDPSIVNAAYSPNQSVDEGIFPDDGSVGNNIGMDGAGTNINSRQLNPNSTMNMDFAKDDPASIAAMREKYGDAVDDFYSQDSSFSYDPLFDPKSGSEISGLDYLADNPVFKSDTLSGPKSSELDTSVASIPTAEEISNDVINYDPNAPIPSASSGDIANTLGEAERQAIRDENKKQGTKYRSAPNAAETAQLTEVVKRLGSEPMTKKYQDGIVAEMKKNGATATEIADYRKYSPVGSDINPFYDTFTETLNDKTRTITGKDGTKVTLDGKEYGFMDKAAAALRNILNFGISSLTYGFVDPAEMDRTKAEKYMEALQETGTYAYGSEDDLDISPGAEGDANFEKLEELTGNYDYTGTENPDGTMSYSGTGVGAGSTLQGVFDAEGNVVEGFNEYRNTPDGAVAVSKEVVREKDKDEFNICEEGFEFDPKEGICMPIASSGGEDTQPILKPRPVRPDTPTPPIDNMPIKPDVEGVKVRKVKQFAQGGSVTPNIDNFLANLGSQGDKRNNERH